MATKTSICLFYLTLAKNQQVFKWTTIATLAVVNVAGLALTLLNIFQCRPMGAAFNDPPSPKATCIDIVTLYLSSAPVNIVTDLALLFLPMPILTSMRLPRNEKIILIVTFSFGGFVAVVDVVRIAYLESASLARLENTTGSDDRNLYGDYSWIASLSFMWSAVEVHVGIICACVPGVKPLAAKIFPRLLGKIKAASDLQGNAYHGSGDGQWACATPRNRASTAPPSSSGHRSPLGPRSPTSPSFPSGPPKDASDDGPDMGMMDFLTTPDTNGADLARHETKATYGDSNSRARTPSLTIFDFVKVKNPKSMVKMSNRESIFPNSLVTVLFFLWGFAYGLLAVLNQRFQVVVNITPSQAIALHSAYYGAYFVAPLTVGLWVFRKSGFKTTFVVGLCIYGIGTLVFWPSAVLASFPAFLISNFIIGLGVATLETAGNPFITLCGPPEYAEVRLNISQGVQAIGSIVSPLLAKQVLFKNVLSERALIDVQWTYLGIALFDVILALIFFYLPIPEASNADLCALASKRSATNNRKILGLPVIHLTLIVGIFSNFCYVGGQEAVAQYFQSYVSTVRPNPVVSPFNYQAIGHTVFAVGRFMTAALGLWIKPRHLLTALYIGVITTAALAMNLSGYAGVAMIVLIPFFESGIFSLIFAISLRGMGAQTKMAAVLLTASTCGGSVMPGIMDPVRDARGVQYAFCVAVAVFAFGAVMPLYLESVPSAKKQTETGRVRRKGLVLGVDDGAGREEKGSGHDGGNGFLRRVMHRKRRRRKEKGKDKENGEGSSDSTATEGAAAEGHDSPIVPDSEHVESPAPVTRRTI